MKKYIFLFSCIGFVVFQIGCKKENHGGADNANYMNAQDCTGINPTFSIEIQPILNISCATPGCHDANTSARGIRLDERQNTIDAFNNHRFLCSVNHGNGCANMPLNAGKLAEGDVEKITCWAKNGFPE